jgi:hypothetical protein
MKDIGYHSLDISSHLRNVFRTQEIYAEECNSEIENSKNEVYAECVPAIGFYEVF